VLPTVLGYTHDLKIPIYAAVFDVLTCTFIETRSLVEIYRVSGRFESTYLQLGYGVQHEFATRTSNHARINKGEKRGPSTSSLLPTFTQYR